MSEEKVHMRAEETHKVLTRHYVEVAKRYADLKVDAPSWTTNTSSGAVAYVFIYLQVDCDLAFPGGPKLTFSGKGIVAGLGATGSLGGQATFNVNPNTLKSLSGITFEAWGLSVGPGGFQITWYKDNKYIGHAEYYGLGVSIGTPGGGWGSFA